MTEIELLTGIYNTLHDIRLFIIIVIGWLVVRAVFDLFNRLF